MFCKLIQLTLLRGKGLQDNSFLCGLNKGRKIPKIEKSVLSTLPHLDNPTWIQTPVRVLYSRLEIKFLWLSKRQIWGKCHGITTTFKASVQKQPIFICKGLRANLTTHFYSVAFVKRVVDLNDVIKLSLERETGKLVLSRRSRRWMGWDVLTGLKGFCVRWGTLVMRSTDKTQAMHCAEEGKGTVNLINSSTFVNWAVLRYHYWRCAELLKFSL